VTKRGKGEKRKRVEKNDGKRAKTEIYFESTPTLGERKRKKEGIEEWKIGREGESKRVGRGEKMENGCKQTGLIHFQVFTQANKRRKYPVKAGKAIHVLGSEQKGRGSYLK
jgi:hypothetical protein